MRARARCEGDRDASTAKGKTYSSSSSSPASIDRAATGSRHWSALQDTATNLKDEDMGLNLSIPDSLRAWHRELEAASMRASRRGEAGRSGSIPGPRPRGELERGRE